MVAEDCNTCKHKDCWEYAEPCNSCSDINGTPEKWEPQTNADRIRTMTDEELAEYFSALTCFPEANKDICKGVANCELCWLEWLKQEVGE